MNTIQLLVPFAAGMAGGLAGIYLHGRITKDVKILLAFSGAYLFALAVMHLLPDIYLHLGSRAGIFILVGFLLQMLMEYFSKGVEHGHIHKSDQHSKTFPLGIYISLFLHSMIEGLPLNGGEEALHHHHHGHSHGDHQDALLIGIAIHKIPEAIALAALLYHFFSEKKRVILLLLVYSLATPLGMLIGKYILSGDIENPEILYAQILAIAVGIFLHVSTTIIFEAEDQHRFNWKKTLAILAGLALVLLV